MDLRLVFNMGRYGLRSKTYHNNLLFPHTPSSKHDLVDTSRTQLSNIVTPAPLEPSLAPSAP